MSRFGYEGDEDYNNQWFLWQHNLVRHMSGPLGQKDLLDLHAALLALPERKLIHGRIADEQGHVCAVGALALKRRTEAGESREKVIADMAEIEDCYGQETADIGMAVGMKRVLAWEIGFENDEGGWYKETDEERFERILRWVESRIQPVPV